MPDTVAKKIFRFLNTRLDHLENSIITQLLSHYNVSGDKKY